MDFHIDFWIIGIITPVIAAIIAVIMWFIAELIYTAIRRYINQNKLHRIVKKIKCRFLKEVIDGLFKNKEGK